MISRVKFSVEDEGVVSADNIDESDESEVHADGEVALSDAL